MKHSLKLYDRVDLYYGALTLLLCVSCAVDEKKDRAFVTNTASAPPAAVESNNQSIDPLITDTASQGTQQNKDEAQSKNTAEPEQPKAPENTTTPSPTAQENQTLQNLVGKAGACTSDRKAFKEGVITDTTNGVNVRINPDSKSTRVGGFPNSQNIKIWKLPSEDQAKALQDEWHCVSGNDSMGEDVHGWILARFVKSKD